MESVAKLHKLFTDVEYLLAFASHAFSLAGTRVSDGVLHSKWLDLLPEKIRYQTLAKLAAMTDQTYDMESPIIATPNQQSIPPSPSYTSQLINLTREVLRKPVNITTKRCRSFSCLAVSYFRQTITRTSPPSALSVSFWTSSNANLSTGHSTTQSHPRSRRIQVSLANHRPTVPSPPQQPH